MAVFVNRSLNLKQIRMVGFDMDYTLVRYHVEEFETLTHQYAVELLIKDYGYPRELSELRFEARRAILGLVIDKRNGNLLKLTRYGKVKLGYHGLQPIDFRTLKTIYQNVAIELRDPEYQALDTSFAISAGVLFSQVVELKTLAEAEGRGKDYPTWAKIAGDVLDAIDMVHRNGSIKQVIAADMARFVIPDPQVAQMLERYKSYGKKLMIITNSDYAYTKLLLEHALDPWWKAHKSWREVFDVVITLADKPQFFERRGRFLAIDPATGAMSNHEGSVATGLFQGGWFKKLQTDLDLQGNEILYIGDHIYGDVVSIKKRCDWRTALVLGDLDEEIAGIHRCRDISASIQELMEEKSALEREINHIDLERHEGATIDQEVLDRLFERTDALNAAISELLGKRKDFFNPWWGEVLRSGQEESRYADQIDKYACIYMSKVSDLYEYSPKTFFRPFRRIMPHEA